MLRTPRKARMSVGKQRGVAGHALRDGISDRAEKLAVNICSRYIA